MNQNFPGTLNNSRPPPNTSRTSDDVASYKAALKGASLAFQGQRREAKSTLATPVTSTRNIGDGALIAATSASASASASASRETSPSRIEAPAFRTLNRNTTGNTVRGVNNDYDVEQRTGRQKVPRDLPSTPQGHLMAPGKLTLSETRSPSFIAATLAVSRSASPSPRVTPQSHPYAQPAARLPRRGSVFTPSAASSVTSLDLVTDTTSIPPTDALISMFEKRDEGDPVKKSPTHSTKNKSFASKPNFQPSTPPRLLSPVIKHDTSPSRPVGPLAWERTPTPPASDKDLSIERPLQSSKATVDFKKRPPTPPPTRSRVEVNGPARFSFVDSTGKSKAKTPPPRSTTQAQPVILSPQPRRATAQKLLTDQPGEAAAQAETSRAGKAISGFPSQDLRRTAPREIRSLTTRKPPKRPEDRRRRASSTSSNDTFVSASSGPSPQNESPPRGLSRPSSPNSQQPRRPPSAHSVPTSTGRARSLLQKNTGSNLPLNSLTNAIVAGSLASARMTPVNARPPTPPPRKQTPHMRHTLRKPRSKSDAEESRAQSRHRKKGLGKLGPGNKHFHHEGARKRWREEITHRERRRYEGVWASNRGLLLDGSDARSELLVANVVVRDIWSRSRLPFDELGEVWDLVDRQGKGVLDRTEFVVGMWLIDQRLRGRKIPQKVSESVWGSVQGMKVRGPKAKKK